ncbi:AAA family ATPase [Stratiformator vulcanicus]|uniref:ATPase RavA n=1 Tax=Stratiformator vulcanicus TaxID=2527980 RepID=A0A517R5E0_9PLAN|nr:MoxR family ATPase [Stratiformator vulcanicus]QDT39108.1 ATPase RavA [Stratiformator vulcanicus]
MNDELHEQRESEKPREPVRSDVQRLEAAAQLGRTLRAELAKVIVGQDEVAEQILITMLCGGHALLEGVPGLAKTLLVRSVAELTDLSFSRIQFTPDLMPADVVGAEIIGSGGDDATAFRFIKGPVFANLILADEVNRTSPRTQSALLEAMQEHQVTVGGASHSLPRPFCVLATQNPIEQEGTYPLPEAQLDRFLMRILVDYPSEEDELEIVRRTTATALPTLQAIANQAELTDASGLLRLMPIGESTARFAIRLVRATRPNDPNADDPVNRYISWGAGPRASQALILSAKARAMLRGRAAVELEDVKAMAAPVLRHRIVTDFEAEADRVTVDQIVTQLVEALSAEDAAIPKWMRSLIKPRN